ncbi:MAG TPA: xanthine dehydrogenase family protein subunit M [Chloroflexota bacterium]|nr:xanthine dehydrogenase family protein subunit M [Chloroflexota bacterium]
MRPFDLLLPTTVDDAIALAAQHGDDARWIAGGAMLIALLRERLLQARALISVVDIPTLQGVATSAAGVHIGAATTLRAIERSAELAQRLPVLAEALRLVGNVRVRNVATIGGHLAQADIHMDLPPVLMALDATVGVRGPSGLRRLPVGDLLVDYYETCLEPDELIVDVDVPSPSPALRGAYRKYCALSPNDWPTVGVAALLEPDDGRVREARVVVGCVANRPLRVPSAEAILRGERLSQANVGEVARRYAAAAEPLDDVRGSADYKRTVTEVFVRRTLESAADRAGLEIR